MLLKADTRETLVPVESCKRLNRLCLGVAEGELCRRVKRFRDCWLKGDVEENRSFLSRTLPGLRHLFPRKEDVSSSVLQRKKPGGDVVL
jgi:hypothetical protein